MRGSSTYGNFIYLGCGFLAKSSVFGDYFTKLGENGRYSVDRQGRLQRLQVTLQDRPFRRSATYLANFLLRRRARLFCGGEELFVQFFSISQTSEADANLVL